MSPEAQRIAIAKACGWTGAYYSSVFGAMIGYPPSRGCDKMVTDEEGCVPDYCGDLNAMHEAEMELSKDEYRWYCNYLREEIDGDSAISAKAYVRAMCFLKAKKVWPESP